MKKFIIGTVVALGMMGGLGWGTTAHAQTKWTSGTPKALRGTWMQYRVSHSGADTTVEMNALHATPKSWFVMTDFGGQAYGGRHVVYRLSHGVYRLRDFDASEKTWHYSRVKLDGQKLTLSEYGRRRSGQSFKPIAGKPVHLTHNLKFNPEWMK